jgi:hypothetical protein
VKKATNCRQTILNGLSTVPYFNGLAFGTEKVTQKFYLFFSFSKFPGCLKLSTSVMEFYKYIHSTVDIKYFTIVNFN